MLYVYIVMVEGGVPGTITTHRSCQGAEVEILSRYPAEASFDDGRAFGPDMLEEALELTGFARITFEDLPQRDDYAPPPCPVLRVERHVLGV